MKSSAASVSILLPSLLGGREATPIRPSVLPVVKKKGSPNAPDPSTSTTANAQNKRLSSRITIFLSQELWISAARCRRRPHLRIAASGERSLRTLYPDRRQNLPASSPLFPASACVRSNL